MVRLGPFCFVRTDFLDVGFLFLSRCSKLIAYMNVSNRCNAFNRPYALFNLILGHLFYFREFQFSTTCLFQTVGVGRLFHYLYVEFIIGQFFNDNV